MIVKDILTGELIESRPEFRIINGKKGRGFSYVFSMYTDRFPYYYNNGDRYRIAGENVAKNLGLVYNESTDTYMDRDQRSNPDYDVRTDHYVGTGNITKILPKPLSIKQKIKFGIESPTYLISEGKRFTFGAEIETSSGRVEPFLLNDFNVSVERDGSLYDDRGRKAQGGEYVTGVLKGDTGFIHLRRLLGLLSKRTKINKTCSVHVHIGGFNFNKETIVMLWKLGLILQNELYQMMPKSRYDSRHCRPMRGAPSSITFPKSINYEKRIDDYYNRIVRNVSLVGKPSKIINKKFNHPKGHYCGYDTSTPRYWWLNFVPALFNLKGQGNQTIEFRMHGATLNYTKVRNWILICMGIVSVAIDHKRFLIANNNFTLADIMKLAYPRKGQYLIDYIEERKRKFSKTDVDLVEMSEYAIKPEKVNVSAMEVVWD